MATDLSEYTDVLRREVTPPGSTLFEDVSEDTMTGYLADALWEATLDGVLSGYSADTDGLVTPDLPREKVALLVLYAGIRILRNQILNTNTTFRAQAGPVEFETQNSATMLAEMLRQLRDVKNRIIESLSSYEGTDSLLIDGLTIRSLSPGSYGGFLNDLFFETLGS